jgi:hypothetical protein
MNWRWNNPSHLAASLILISALGCGEDKPKDYCTPACDKLYDSDECGFDNADSGGNGNKSTCMNTCSDATTKEGPIGDYDPWTPIPLSQTADFENATQAEEWSKCILDTNCEDLAGGYCEPVW